MRYLGAFVGYYSCPSCAGDAGGVTSAPADLKLWVSHGTQPSSHVTEGA